MKDEEIVRVTTIPQPRRKGTGSKVWLVVSEFGQSRVEEVGKHSVMRRTGLPARDLRVLDPLLSYPSTILGRERAIVINLEHIKAIITAKEVLMVNSTNPLVVQFVQDLQHRVCSPSGVLPSEVTMNNSPSPNSYSPVDVSSKEMKSGRNRSSFDEPVPKCPKSLPFEFRALEACLESACRCLDSETRTLELEAYPALDELTSKISTLNLERVRQIKSRLVAISGRVQKMRDELEHLLDDDNDMAEMYLTEKLISQAFDQEPPCGEEERNDDVEAGEMRRFKCIPTSNAVRLPKEAGQHEAICAYFIINVLVNSPLGVIDPFDLIILYDRSESDSASEVSHDFKPNTEELEMLLEAYFAQTDGILQKLSDMSEYVDDTEDCINIMLDDKQNQLLQMGVMLSTANMILNAGIVVVGLFGMNIHIDLYDGKPRQFWETALGTAGGCVAMTLIAFGWGKKKRLLAS